MENLNKIRNEILENKIKRNFNTTDVGKEIILITEELGELAKSYKLSNQKQASEIDNLDDIEDAITDILIYCFGLYGMLNIDAEKAIMKVLNNNKIRTHKGYIK